MKEAKENTFLPPDETSEILENLTQTYLSDSAWKEIEPILAALDGLKEENVKEGV